MPLEAMNPADLQRLINSRGLKWRAGSTSVSGLSEQQKRIRLGAVPPGALPTASGAAGARGAGATYPASFDWRNVNGQNYVTVIEDQGGCGSCVAFGVTATFEAMFQVSRGNPQPQIDLSEAQLFYCGGAAAGATCETGWWPDQALSYCQNSGLADAGCFPYTAGDQSCNLCSDWQSRVRSITSSHVITSTDDMKTWLSTNGPLSTCFAVYNDFFSYTSGVYTHVSGDLAGGHCVSCIGYDDTQGCWICKNSWGTGWGENGFFQIAYGQGAYPDGSGGIDSQMWAIDAIAATGWENGTHVQGLWAIDQDLNAWAYFDGGIGWRKVAPDNTNIFFDILVQLASAKAAGRPVNFYANQGVIQQVYVL
jgi:C1A family cysteine protease